MNQGVKEYVNSIFEGKGDDMSVLMLKEQFTNSINYTISKYLDSGNDYKSAFEKAIYDFENEIPSVDRYIAEHGLGVAGMASDIPLTEKFKFGSLVGGFWICTSIVYLLYSFVSGNWHTSWTIFLFASSITILFSAMNGGGVKKGHLIGAFWPALTAVYILLSFWLGIWAFSWVIFLFGALFSVLLSGYNDNNSLKYRS